uniref:Endonuclease/exonuclease/phosphatase domain-containing protein n=1 Tax=Neolamprologus brichardi TaxID=32507 RepID=A0A3Q4HA05_NEOBR
MGHSIQVKPFNNLSIMSWNIKGLNNAVKKNKILCFIKSKKCDIAFVQETHLLPPDSHGTSKSRGVATLISKHLQFKCIQKIKGDAGRMMLMLCEIQGKTVILANVYAPNPGSAGGFFLLKGSSSFPLSPKCLLIGGHMIVGFSSVRIIVGSTLQYKVP